MLIGIVLVRVVAALRPARRAHVFLHQSGHHLQPDADREGQQSHSPI
ncbi:hypothetical protein [Pseudonocardia acidicola]|uniref:Uncharacterized protein n=1 Tax=Pseudonocardia acidicola TaxID=2724939 RepID=A0ABX1S4R7_9PSEU|nr:hypothetical protein [Pseudonocardia acidicola]NMH96580.1 hypothetical protein [Pseudonocardia acidicola]